MSGDDAAASNRFEGVMNVKGTTTKATRERQRRIRLNDSFMELAKALDPGKIPKADKASIVADAIRVVTQLRTENGQLHQLNKFLEERVADYEKARSDLVMRQAMYQNSNVAAYMQQPALQQQMLPAKLAAGVVLGQPVQDISLQKPMHSSMAIAHPSHLANQNQACNVVGHDFKTENTLCDNLYSQPPNAMMQLSELLNSDQNIFDWTLDSSNGASMNGLLQPGPSSEIANDHIKRPPAA